MTPIHVSKFKDAKALRVSNREVVMLDNVVHEYFEQSNAESIKFRLVKSSNNKNSLSVYSYVTKKTTSLGVFIFNNISTDMTRLIRYNTAKLVVQTGNYVYNAYDYRAVNFKNTLTFKDFHSTSKYKSSAQSNDACDDVIDKILTLIENRQNKLEILNNMHDKLSADINFANAARISANNKLMHDLKCEHAVIRNERKATNKIYAEKLRNISIEYHRVESMNTDLKIK